MPSSPPLPLPPTHSARIRETSPHELRLIFPSFSLLPWCGRDGPGTVPWCRSGGLTSLIIPFREDTSLGRTREVAGFELTQNKCRCVCSFCRCLQIEKVYCVWYTGQLPHFFGWYTLGSLCWRLQYPGTLPTSRLPVMIWVRKAGLPRVEHGKQPVEAMVSRSDGDRVSTQASFKGQAWACHPKASFFC